MEIWKDIDEHKNYQISNHGRFKNKKKNNILILKKEKNGYLRIGITINKKKKYFSIHRLVAKYFVNGFDENKVVNHKDGNKENNNYINLEWVTQLENISHAVVNGFYNTRGENNHNSKLTDNDIKFIIDNYKPMDSQFSGVKLAKRFNVYKSTIYKIVQGRAWKNKGVI